MAQMAARQTLAQRIQWDTRIRPLLARLLLLAIGVVAGMYIVAPLLRQASPTYLPPAVLTMPTGVVELINADGSAAMLPVRIADTADARSLGLRRVGAKALDNLFLLYAHPRETTTRYNLQGVRAPIEMAVIDAAGNVIAIKTPAADASAITISERHRWVLAAKAGTLAHYGIGAGTTLDPASIRKLNL